jgi:hypothetical protein
VGSGAKIVWVAGELIVTFAVAAGVAWAKDYRIASLVSSLLAIAGIAANWFVLRGLEATMSHRLLVKSSKKLPVAPNAAGLLGFLVPVGDLFGDDLGWLLMVVLLASALVIRQLVKTTPPGLFLLVFGYKPHQVTVSAGAVEVWVSGKAQLSPGDVVMAVEAEQALWIGTIAVV